jgi:DNA polymerase
MTENKTYPPTSKPGLGDPQSIIRFDVETRSEVDLKKCGPWVYAKHPSTELLVLKFAVGDNAVQTFIPTVFNGCRVPPTWERAVSSPGTLFEAFNAFFEWSIYNHVLVARYGWPVIPPERWRCAMATSCFYALPRSLDMVASDALHLDHQKDKEGHRVMMKLSKPRKPTKNNPAKYHAKLEDFKKLYAYCEKDVETHRAISHTIGSLPPDELLIWQVDQMINKRGVYCDVQAVQGAIAILDQVMGWYQDDIKDLTDGKIQTTGQTAKIVDYCAARGVTLENLQAGTVIESLAGALPSDVRQILSLRQSASKSSMRR